MIKQLFTFSSFAVGGAGLAFIGFLQTHPMALTHPVVAESRAVETMSVPAPPATSPAQLDSIVLGEEIIVAKPRKTTTVARVPEASKPLEPCTDWRSIGANYVTEGRAVGSHLVRGLCEQ
jgi:hypothetical protein